MDDTPSDSEGDSGDGEERDDPAMDLFTTTADEREMEETAGKERTEAEDSLEDDEDGDGIRGLSYSGTWFTAEDRPRGILSPTDREYLTGEKEYAQQQTDANRRQAIRERIVNGLKDFSLLFLMPPEEREKVFDELDESEIDDTLSLMFGFAYLGLDGDRPRFETCIEHGVLQAENVDKLFQSAGRATDVDASISVEYNPDVKKLYRRFQEGKELTDAELGLLLRKGILDEEEIREFTEHSGSVDPWALF